MQSLEATVVPLDLKNSQKVKSLMRPEFRKSGKILPETKQVCVDFLSWHGLS